MISLVAYLSPRTGHDRSSQQYSEELSSSEVWRSKSRKTIESRESGRTGSHLSDNWRTRENKRLDRFVEM